MFAVHARYRGRSAQRAELVEQSAQALSTLDGIDEFARLGVEDIRSIARSAESVYEVTMALLADGDWAVGIGATPGDVSAAEEAATRSLRRSSRAGRVYAVVDDVDLPRSERAARASDICAVFALLSHVLGKRTPEGREATSLVRAGWNQNEAAQQLGISKQAMSQRLQAAGWGAETAGWQLALRTLKRAVREVD